MANPKKPDLAKDIIGWIDPDYDEPSAPWLLPPTDNADIFAIQAIAKGIANEGQQRRAMDYILRALCDTDRMTFWPGATDFIEGKRWVGLQLRRIEKAAARHGLLRPAAKPREHAARVRYYWVD